MVAYLYNDRSGEKARSSFMSAEGKPDLMMTMIVLVILLLKKKKLDWHDNTLIRGKSNLCSQRPVSQSDITTMQFTCDNLPEQVGYTFPLLHQNDIKSPRIIWSPCTFSIFALHGVLKITPALCGSQAWASWPADGISDFSNYSSAWMELCCSTGYMYVQRNAIRGPVAGVKGSLPKVLSKQLRTNTANQLEACAAFPFPFMVTLIVKGHNPELCLWFCWSFSTLVQSNKTRQGLWLTSCLWT